MHKGTLRVHQIKLVIDTGEHFSNGSSIADHTNCPHDLGKISTWHNCGWLVVDATLEACWRPVNKLNCTFGLDSCDGCIHILWHHISAIHHAASHVLTMARVTF